MDLWKMSSMNQNRMRPPSSVLYSPNNSARKNWFEVSQRMSSLPTDRYYIPRGRRPISQIDAINSKFTNKWQGISNKRDEYWSERRQKRAYEERKDLYEQLDGYMSM